MKMDRNRVQLFCSRLTGKVRPRGGTPLWLIDLVATDLASIEDWKEVVYNKQ